jgi:hypothetical protein
MRRVKSLSPALRAVVYVGVIAAMSIMAVGLGVVATVVFERGSEIFGEAEPQSYSEQEEQQASDQEEYASSQLSAAEYIAEVGDIQNGSVESFVRVHDKLLRYDSLTPADVEEIEADQAALKDYTDRNDNLTPPEEYRGHHELLSVATGELSDAAEIAHRVAADTVSATSADFREYDSLVTGAATSLRRSNEVLGQNYRTTEGLPRVGPRAL